MRQLLAVLMLLCSPLALPEDGAPLFAASFPDLGQQNVALAAYRGKPLIVNFWARWCAPCREEIPLLRAIAKDYQANGLNVIGIGVENPQPSVLDFVKAYEIDYPVLFAGSAGIALMKALGNTRAGLPFTLALDRQGRIVMFKLGKVSRADLEAAAQAALK